MYHHAFISLGVFVLLFASIEFAIAGGLWAVLAAYFSFAHSLAPR